MTEIGLKWFRVVLMGFSFLAVSQVHAAPTSTQRFIASLTDELEAKVIGDNELAALIHSAEGGHVANPICETTAALSTERLLAHEVFQGYIDAGDLNAAEIATWARENLVESERGHKQRGESRKETEKLHKPMLLSVAKEYSCAVNMDGFVQCWSTCCEFSPNHRLTPPSDLGPVKAIATGEHHVCAVQVNGNVKCWGSDSLGQSSPPSDLGKVDSISAGDAHTCAVQVDGVLRCWGSDLWKQLQLPADLGLVRSVSSNTAYNCAVKADQSVKCWGFGSNGETSVPSDLAGVQSVSAGQAHACAVKDDGSVRCWGNGTGGRLNVPSDLRLVTTVSVGNCHSCAVTVDGVLKCWGVGPKGEAMVPPDLGRVLWVAVAESHVCVVQANGNLRCWEQVYTNNYYRKILSPVFFPEDVIVKSSGSQP